MSGDAVTSSGRPPTPQARKLGLTEGGLVHVDGAPDGWSFTDPPPLVTVAPGEPADVVVTFVRALAELPGRVDALSSMIRPAGALWIAWPRRAAGHVSDVGDSAVRECVLSRGLVDVKVAAIDDDWSALKIVWRRENR